MNNEKQLSLVQSEKTKVFLLQETVQRRQEEKEEEHRLKNKFSIEYCLKTIEEEMYLWDMRFWNNLKDLQEIKEFINGDDDKNCGHAHLCIKTLLIHQVPEEKIIEAIMKNNNIQYKKVICKGCAMNPRSCPKYKEQGHYGGNMCEPCDEKVGA